MAILFHTQDVTNPLSDQKPITSWIEAVINGYNKTPGELNIIFCSDEYLLSINREWLQHDYYTDIITFDYSEQDTVEGDLYISIERVKDNATSLDQTYQDELHRVIIHGILHLIGFSDKTEEEQQQMRERENAALQLLP